MTDYLRPVHSLFGIPVDAVTTEEAAARLERAKHEQRHCFLSTPNLNILLGAREDEALLASICRSDLSVADGMPLVWLARLAGVPLPERVSGSGLFDWMRGRAPSAWRIFFFGGPQEVGQRACSALAAQGGPFEGCGHLYPGYGSVEEMSRADWIRRINDSRPDFVVVSLGAQKGQAWIVRNLPALQPAVVSHLGAVVNFVAGTVRRAPVWMQRTGLEWAWRMKEEPRLWRRYAGDAAGLARIVLRQALPLAWLRLVAQPAAGSFLEPRCESGFEGERATIRLVGAWREDNLMPLRHALRRAETLATHVRIDLRATQWMDSAAAGLLLLLEAQLHARGGSLALQGASPRLRRLLTLQGLGRLLEA